MSGLKDDFTVAVDAGTAKLPAPKVLGGDIDLTQSPTPVTQASTAQLKQAAEPISPNAPTTVTVANAIQLKQAAEPSVGDVVFRTLPIWIVVAILMWGVTALLRKIKK
jgi:hypothetical protein